MKYELKCKACKRKQLLESDDAKVSKPESHTVYTWDCPNCGEAIEAKTFWRRT